MKYETKFEMDQEVWVIYGKSVVMRQVAQIRITHEPKYQRIAGNAFNEKVLRLVQGGGVKIEYLLGVQEGFNAEGIRNSVGYEWYSENDVATTKEELLGRF